MTIHIKTFAIIWSLILLVGCATERTVTPTINTQPRQGLSLKTPVQASVFDGRTDGSQDQTTIQLENELSRIYGSNFEWVPYFNETPPGRVSIKYRVVKLGANFGSRIITTIGYASAVQSYQASVPNAWNPIFINGVSNTSVQASSFTGEGWWNGGAWVDIEVTDNRSGHQSRFTIPIAAEHRESNVWGYTSGDKAAKKAWETVASQITRITDSALRMVRDAEG
jgi:hypothetical protein